MSRAVLVAAVRRGLRSVFAAAIRALVPVEASPRPSSATIRGTQNTAPTSTPTNETAPASIPTASCRLELPAARLLATAVSRRTPAPPTTSSQGDRQPDATCSGTERRSLRGPQSGDRRDPGGLACRDERREQGHGGADDERHEDDGRRDADRARERYPEIDAVEDDERHLGQHRARDEPDERGTEAEDRCLEQHRPAQLALARADAAEHGERPGALRDEDLERVRDDERRDEHRDRGEPEHHGDQDVPAPGDPGDGLGRGLVLGERTGVPDQGRQSRLELGGGHTVGRRDERGRAVGEVADEGLGRRSS